MKHQRPMLAGAAVLLLANLLCACAAPPNLSADFGRSYRTCFARQVVNPGAPDDPAPVQGVPGYIGTQIYNEGYIGGLLEPQAGSSTSGSAQ